MFLAPCIGNAPSCSQGGVPFRPRCWELPSPSLPQTLVVFPWHRLVSTDPFSRSRMLGAERLPGLLLFTQMGADTSKVSADSTFPHAAAGRIPGQSGSQRRGMREGWVGDAILPCPLSSGSWHHGITSGCPPGLLRARAGTEPGGKAQTGSWGWESASHPDCLPRGWVFSPLQRSASDEG